MGIGYKHDRDFHIMRPQGSGDNLLVVFKTRAAVTLGGTRQIVPADTAVVYRKSTPQDYGAAGEEYINHWIHFECDENDVFFDALKIPFDRPVPVSSVFALEGLLSLLQTESLSDTAKSRECASLLIKLIIAQLRADSADTPETPHSEGLTRLRTDIYAAPGGKFSIEEMAARLSLSPSYFQALYRREFGVSCYEDVLRAKTALAEYYLTETNMTVREISELCGFENDVHFMRQFRKRTGKTALQYRKTENRK